MSRSAGGRAGRDRAVDFLRALAIAGVVLGHWLVTALVLQPDGAIVGASPLSHLDGLAPVTWLLQTLGLFFFAAGFGAARSTDRGVGRSTGRMRRLVLPPAGFVGVWAAALVAAALAGAPADSLRTVGWLAVSPLWFILVLAALTVFNRPVRAAAAHPWGPPAVTGVAVAVVGTADAGYGWMPVTVLAAWLVPYTLGIAAADGRLGGRRTAGATAIGGLGALLLLIFVAGYPASAVGVPGQDASNLGPPSLAALALAVTQVGVALLARPAIARWLDRPRPYTVVAAVNRAAMPIYLWHQTALIGVTLLALRLSDGTPVAGLHTAPDAGWLGVRLLWLPVVAAVLALIAWPRAAGQPAGWSTDGARRG